MAKILHSRSAAAGVDRKVEAVAARSVLDAKTRAEDLAKIAADAAAHATQRRGKTYRLRSGAER